jgi:hypothetical protein
VRDEKMLEKLAMHDVYDIVELFNLADKCARAIEGGAWHMPPALEVEKASKTNSSDAAQGSGNNNNNNKKKKKKKKADGNNQLLVGTPTVVVAVASGGQGLCNNKCPRQVSDSDDEGARCLVHNSRCHNAEECREIKKFTEQFREQQKQQPLQGGMPSFQREDKQKVDPKEDKDKEMEF